MSRVRERPEDAVDCSLVAKLVGGLRRDPAAFADRAALVAASGLSATELERRTRRHFHAGVDALLERARIARARELLRMSRASPSDIAVAAGFADREAFETVFGEANGLSPGGYRRMLGRRSFVLRLPPDFAVASTWRYLGRDAERTTEWVEGRRGRRMLRHGRGRHLLEFEQRGDRLAVRVVGGSTPSPAAMAAYHEQLWRWFGLAAHPSGFERRAARQRGWSALLRRQRGLRLPLTPTVFESLVWAIVGQQVNLAFAYRLRRVVVELCQPSARQGLRAHPTAREVARLDYADLTRRQFSRRKAEYVIDAARLAAERREGFEPWAARSATDVAKELLAIRGVGEWTQQYVLMRGCGFADCVPVGDAGLTKALQRFHGMERRPDGEQTRALMAPLAPYRSLATAHLWASLYTDTSGDEPADG